MWCFRANVKAETSKRDLFYRSVEFLLKRGDSFHTGPAARKWFFTDRFLEVMLQDSVNQEFLQKADKSAAKVSKHRRTDNLPPQRIVVERVVEQRPRQQGLLHHRDNVYGYARGGHRGRRSSLPGHRFVHSFSFPPNSPVHSPSSVVGARLSGFAQKWEMYYNYPWVLNTNYL